MVLWARMVVYCLVLFTCFGCGASAEEAKIIGEWKGAFHGDDGKKIKGANMSFDEDHRFRELYGNLEVKGSWSLKGKVLTLRPETVGGTSIEEARKRIIVKGNNDKAALAMAEGLDKPIPLRVSSDGKTLTTQPDAAAGGYAVYTKQ